MVRIVTFSSLFPSSVRPGHGIFVETRLRELVASGQVDVRVVAPVPWFFSTNPRYGEYARISKTPRREIHNGIDVLHPRYFLPPKVGMTIAPLSMALGALSAFQQLLAEGFDFDVIDAHYYYPDGVAAAWLARHFKRPFTVTARGSDINLISRFLTPRLLMRRAAQSAAMSIGVSTALTYAMEELGMPASKLVTMQNGVDLDKFSLRPQAEARAELGWPHGPTILSVGNLVENKGHGIAIESLAGLPQFRLVIVGEGPLRQTLEFQVRRANLSSRVQFLGAVEQNRLATCYSAADMLVLASSREGWPNVLLESMACGTRVVATSVGGIPEIVTSDTLGELMQERTAAALVKAVNALQSRLPDRLAVRARALMSSWQLTTDMQLALFGRLSSQKV